MRQIAVAILLLVGCSQSRGTPGEERADCRAGDKDKCNAGLLCLSNVCVRPPPADCQSVAESLASFDLGNYAEPEERAPVVAKYRSQCEKAYVTKEQGECLDKATDKWAAGQCAPKMFPEMASTNNGDCKKVVERVQAAIKDQIQTADPQMAKWFETTMTIMQQSCEQDAWPDSLKKCILTAQATPGVDAMQSCNQQMPPGLQTKLQERLTAAMQQQMQ
jgi:hypothetical protein